MGLINFFKKRRVEKIMKKGGKGKKELEAVQQMQCMRWLLYSHHNIFKYTFYACNGDLPLKPHQRLRLSKMGGKAGIPDLWHLVACGGFSGLVVEFKAFAPHNARLRTEQKEWLNHLTSQNFKAVCVCGFEEYKQVVNDYVKGATETKEHKQY